MKTKLLIAIMIIMVSIASSQSLKIEWTKNISGQGITDGTTINSTLYTISIPSVITGPFTYEVHKWNGNTGTKIFSGNSITIPRIISANNQILIYRAQSESVILIDTNGTKSVEKIISAVLPLSEIYESNLIYSTINNVIVRIIYGKEVTSGKEATSIERFDGMLNSQGGPQDTTINLESIYMLNGYIVKFVGSSALLMDSTSTNTLFTLALPFIPKGISQGSNALYANDDNSLIKIVYVNSVDIKEYVKDINFKVYPSPTSDYLIIDGIVNPTIQIFDITGQMVMITNENKIDVSHLTTGVYFCSINGLSMKKFIKN